MTTKTTTGSHGSGTNSTSNLVMHLAAAQYLLSPMLFKKK